MLVIASHTGARIGDVSEKTRNITDDVSTSIIERKGIVGIGTAGGMLGGKTLDHLVEAVRHFVKLDPTDGELVTLGHDLNGLGAESMVEGATTILDSHRVAGALFDAGFTREMVENIFWKNAYNFWHSALGDSRKTA